MKHLALAVLVSASSHIVIAVTPEGTAEPKERFKSSSISGVVVDDQDPPRTVRRAIITLAGPGLQGSRGTVSDDAGRFEFDSLPAGRFSLTATRASYVTSMYGARRPGRPGTPIEMTEGTNRDVVLRLWRGAVIAGLVRDENGLPVEGIRVRAIATGRASTDGAPTLSNNGVATNQRGEYRIFGLTAGTYVICATPVGSDDRLMALTDAQVEATFEALRRRVPLRSMPTQAVAGEHVDYAPIFYPGTTLADQASGIALVSGQERLGVDLTLRRVRTSTVTGVVSTREGLPAAGATVQLQLVGTYRALMAGEPRFVSATTAADGRFNITRVTPGPYRLVARYRPQPVQAKDAGEIVISTRPGSKGDQWASMPVSVGDGGNTVSVTVSPGITVSGRIRFEVSKGSSAVAPPKLESLRVALVSPDLELLRPETPIGQLGYGGSTTVSANGTFVIDGLLPDVYRLTITGVGSAWSARSARVAGHDLFDAPTDISSLPVGDIDVLFTDNPTQVGGRLQTASGGPVSDVFVIAFPADRSAWGTSSRRIQAVRPDIGGAYLLRDLPAGEYFLGAVVDIDQGDWLDPSFLERLSAASVRLSLADGERKTQDLKVGGT